GSQRITEIHLFPGLAVILAAEQYRAVTLNKTIAGKQGAIAGHLEVEKAAVVRRMVNTPVWIAAQKVAAGGQPLPGIAAVGRAKQPELWHVVGPVEHLG